VIAKPGEQLAGFVSADLARLRRPVLGSMPGTDLLFAPEVLRPMSDPVCIESRAWSPGCGTGARPAAR
jgi:hypothetical protein